jgi:NTP pyrophosphatase (non-canonical NTP hydrolase)
MSLELELLEAAEQVEVINRANGWFDSERTFGEDIALLHSEVSEMLEAFREHGLADATLPSYMVTAEDDPMWGKEQLSKPEGVGSEAADVLVRLLDTCARYDINLGREFARKLAYNATRGHRHGGKNL